MKPSCRAVIDVGTNSVKLLIAEVSQKEIRPLAESSEQTRLGRGFYETHQLLPEAIAQTARAVASFAEQARLAQADSIVVIATSAARDAVNKDELIAAIRELAELEVQIISGAQEAEWVYQGVTSDPALAGRALLIIDVGGGSTEFILGDGVRQQFRESFALGSVRELERLQLADPPTADQLQSCRAALREFVDRQVCPVLSPFLRRENLKPELVATGGTATIMARMEKQLAEFDRGQLEAARLTLQAVRKWMEHLWALPLAERKQVVGLPKNRADVILTGMAIYEAVMELLGFADLRVSTRGLRFAAVLKLKAVG